MPEPLSVFSIKFKAGMTEGGDIEIELHYVRPTREEAADEPFLLDYDLTIVVHGVPGFEGEPLHFTGELETLRYGMTGRARDLEVGVEYDQERDLLNFKLRDRATGLLLEYSSDKELYQAFLDAIDGKIDPNDSDFFAKPRPIHSIDDLIKDIRKDMQ